MIDGACLVWLGRVWGGVVGKCVADHTTHPLLLHTAHTGHPLDQQDASKAWTGDTSGRLNERRMPRYGADWLHATELDLFPHPMHPAPHTPQAASRIRKPIATAALPSASPRHGFAAPCSQLRHPFRRPPIRAGCAETTGSVARPCTATAAAAPGLSGHAHLRPQGRHPHSGQAHGRRGASVFVCEKATTVWGGV